MSCQDVDASLYCEFFVHFPDISWISAIHIEDQTGAVLLDVSYETYTSDGYRDATDQIIECNPGDTLTISVTVTGDSYTFALSWGHGIAGGGLVKVADLTSEVTPYTHTYTWTVPDNVGSHIISWWIGYYSYTEPCNADRDSINYGERQDYSLCITDTQPTTVVIPVVDCVYEALSPAAALRPPSTLPTSQQVYPVILSVDGLEDLEIPASSVHIRMRHVSASYVRVTMHNPLDLTDEILARADGRVTVYAGEAASGSLLWREQIIYANIQDVTLIRGSQNILEIAGTRYITQSGAQVRDLPSVSRIYKGEHGRYTVRCAIDFSIKPTDTATLADGRAYTIDLIRHVINAREAFMDVEGT